MGSDSPSGANNAWALTSGKLAAEAVWEMTKRPKKCIICLLALLLN